MITKVIKFIFSLTSILFLGLLFGWSIFVTPLEAEFGWERSETSLTFTISMISMCLAILAGGQFNKHKDRPLITLMISAALILTGFFVVSRATHLMTFFIFYGVVGSFGCGFCYVEMITIPSRWFPKHHGLTSGMLMMCVGLGAMVLGTICQAMMASFGWRHIFIGLGICFASILIIEGLVLQSSVNGEQKIVKTVELTEEEERNSLSTKEMMKTADFSLFYIWLVVITSAGLALTGHIAPCALEMGASAGTAAFLMGIVSVSNGCGRIIYGSLYDAIGVKKTVYISITVFLIASITASAAVMTKSVALLFVGCVLIGASFGFAPISGAAVVRRFYGPKYYSSNFSIMGTLLFWGALIGPFTAGKLYTATGDYNATFYMIIGFGIISFILANIVLKKAKKNGRPLS